MYPKERRLVRFPQHELLQKDNRERGWFSILFLYLGVEYEDSPASTMVHNTREDM